MAAIATAWNRFRHRPDPGASFLLLAPWSLVHGPLAFMAVAEVSKKA